MYQFFNPVLVPTNFMGKLAYGECVTGNEYVRSQMDGGDKNPNAPFALDRGHAIKALPERPNMASRQDAGERTANTPTGLGRGDPVEPYNVNARGLDSRRDERRT